MYRLDATALRLVAHYFRQQAAFANARAKTLETRERGHKNNLHRMKFHPHMTDADKRAAARRLRNLDIMRLAARGWPNERIAEKFNLHASTISKIIRTHIDRDEAGWNGRVSERQERDGGSGRSRP